MNINIKQYIQPIFVHTYGVTKYPIPSIVVDISTVIETQFSKNGLY